MTIILEGTSEAEALMRRLSQRVARLASKPLLAVVVVGNDPASLKFIQVKTAQAQRIGIRIKVFAYRKDIGVGILMRQLKRIARDRSIDGIIVQLPLPSALDASRALFLNIIPEEKDVDCLSELWQGKLLSDRTFIEVHGRKIPILPPVSSAIFKLVERYGIPLKGTRVTLVGWGDLVGKPLLPLLMRKGATVSVCTSTTRDLAFFTKNADIVISGAGKARLIRGTMIKKGAIVFDAGYSEVGGQVSGDVDMKSVEGIARMVSPAIGGIGPLTVACLLENVVALAEAREASQGRSRLRGIPPYV